jgi:hypothetical protein
VPADGELIEDLDPARERFIATPAVAGHGRLWLYDDGLSVLVAVDIETLVPSVHAVLGATSEVEKPGRAEAGAPQDPAPGDLHVTRDFVWVAREGQLVAVDPWSDGRRVLEVPAGSWSWATDGDYWWGTSWPSGDVLEVNATTRAQRRVTVGGHLSAACVSGGTLWVVDRTDETLLGLDNGTLQPRLRVPFGGGQIDTLLAWRGGVLAVHALERTVVSGGEIVYTTALWWIEVDGRRHEILRLGPGAVLAVDGDRLWVASSEEPPLVDKRGSARRRASPGPISTLSPPGWPAAQVWPDPVATFQEVRLPEGAPGRKVTGAGEAFHVTVTADRLWVQGFIRSRQAWPVTVVDPERGVVGEVDLGALDLSPYAPAPGDPQPAETPDETLERLPGAVREALTRPGTQIDSRTGERAPVPALDRRFQLVDVTLEPETYDLWVTFTWADEPGKTFGYVCTADPETSSRQTAGEVWVSLMEDLDTGILSWGDRDEVDGVIWVSRPDEDEDDEEDED